MSGFPRPCQEALGLQEMLAGPCEHDMGEIQEKWEHVSSLGERTYYVPRAVLGQRTCCSFGPSERVAKAGSGTLVAANKETKHQRC